MTTMNKRMTLQSSSTTIWTWSSTTSRRRPLHPFSCRRGCCMKESVYHTAQKTSHPYSLGCRLRCRLRRFRTVTCAEASLPIRTSSHQVWSGHRHCTLSAHRCHLALGQWMTSRHTRRRDTIPTTSTVTSTPTRLTKIGNARAVCSNAWHWSGVVVPSSHTERRRILAIAISTMSHCTLSCHHPHRRPPTWLH